MSRNSNDPEFAGDPAYTVSPIYESDIRNEFDGGFYWLPEERGALWFNTLDKAFRFANLKQAGGYRCIVAELDKPRPEWDEEILAWSRRLELDPWPFKNADTEPLMIALWQLVPHKASGWPQSWHFNLDGALFASGVLSDRGVAWQLEKVQRRFDSVEVQCARGVRLTA